MRRTLFLSVVLLVACSEGSESRPTLGESSSSSGESDSSSSDDTPEPRADLGVVPPQACDAACATASACQGITATDCLLQCVSELDAAFATSEACGTQREVLETCLGELSCEQLSGHDAGDDGPCRRHAQEASVACAPGGETPSVCAEFCTAADRCDVVDAVACEAACVEARADAAESGVACASAQDQQFTCVAGLECAALEAWMSGRDTSICPVDFDQACAGDQE